MPDLRAVCRQCSAKAGSRTPAVPRWTTAEPTITRTTKPALSRCLAFENSPAGATSARAAGGVVVGVGVGVGGTCPPEDLEVSIWLDALDRVRLVERRARFGLELAVIGNDRPPPPSCDGAGCF